MKVTYPKFLPILAAGSLMLLGSSTFAADTPAADAKPKATEGQAPVRNRDRFKALTEELKLTEAQQTKLKPIFDELNEKRRALRQDTALSQEDRRAKLKEINEKYTPKFKEILTVEQFETWKKGQQQRVRRPNAQPAPAPAPAK